MPIVAVTTSGSAAGPEENRILVDRVRDQFLTVPGVQSAATVGTVPPFGGITEPVRLDESAAPTVVERNFIGPGYFELLGVAPLAGRSFSADDRARRDPIAVINKNLADSLWPGESPIGRTVLYGERRQRVEIVGVVPNSSVRRHAHRSPPHVHLSPRQPESPCAGSSQVLCPLLRQSRRRCPCDPRGAPQLRRAHSHCLDDTDGGCARRRDVPGAHDHDAPDALRGWVHFGRRDRPLRRGRVQHAAAKPRLGVRLALGASSQQILRSVFLRDSR